MASLSVQARTSTTFASKTEPLRWHDGYDSRRRKGEVIRDTIKTGTPQPSESWCSKPGVRCFPISREPGLTLLFDLNGSTDNDFGLYARHRQAGAFSPALTYSAYGRAAADRERELLETPSIA